MEVSEISDLMFEFFVIAVQLAGPVLLISMALGVIISIFQAATQIHEQTLTFVPKLLVIALILLVMGNSMMATMQDFFLRIMSMI